MMQINVSQQLKEPIGSTRDYKMNGIVEIDGYDRAVRGAVKLTRIDRGILVEGTLETDADLTCSRCLNLFNSPLNLNIEEEYLPTTDVETGTPLPSPEEPDAFTIDEHNILDLTEAIRQYSLLAVPIKPLCRQDCAGLCPSCGTNLNIASCHCPPEQADPRWAALRKLASDTSETSAEKLKGRN